MLQVAIRPGTLRENIVYHVPVHLGQTHILAIVPVCQARVINPEEVQDRRVEVVHAHLVLDRKVAELVRCTVGIAALDASASQPQSESIRVVVATVAAL